MKTCAKCKLELALSEFNKNKRKPDGLHPDCRACKKIYQAAWYQAHRPEQQARVNLIKRELRKKARALVVEAKNKPCVDCRQSYPSYVMDLDHLPGFIKDKDIARLVTSGVSLNRLKAEIAKCEVVCANCHRIRTFTRTPQ